MCPHRAIVNLPSIQWVLFIQKNSAAIEELYCFYDPYHSIFLQLRTSWLWTHALVNLKSSGTKIGMSEPVVYKLCEGKTEIVISMKMISMF